ncbi:type I-E CRISPR-associated protein Cse1/CasA [Anaerococcus sp. AGMB09787]|uniref:type I-E CRISPR-associated protein Cse1/CasA n=1 Tax=Anaerococcus sp. AGMB09787 TaxID=2922869 RepID=UPI001FAE9A3D|nr:type I-E CRISPR-associated protein Cse1/CasA [Anaerococcus sp. AGMB09787]
MGRYNLLKEKWISVSVDNKGYSEDVSLIEVFENADKYLDLAGDTKTQDFAVMRVLLAVLHTVFSRFDANGDPYPEVKLDDRYRQIDPIEDEDERLDYNDQLFETWKNLWNKGSFPNIVTDYLEKWEDHFNLFDEKYPFYQVLYEDISGEEKLKSQVGRDRLISTPSKIAIKHINRRISESENKEFLFSPKSRENKDKLSYSELARWLIAFQAYADLSDKTIFRMDKYDTNNGWISELGGVYFKGKNLFESLMLNLVLDITKLNNGKENNIQRPCWEYSGLENINRSLRGINPDNLSELYTNWAKALYINTELEAEEGVLYLNAVHLRGLDEINYFLEPMTIWNTKNKKDNLYSPKKHEKNQALWRSSGILVTDKSEDDFKKYKKPGIMFWFENISEEVEINNLTINSISMKNKKDSSKIPVDEIYDCMNTRQFILTDLEKGNWTPRINDQVELTKKVIETDYKRFLGDLAFIRNNEGGGFVNKNIERMYFLIDGPFRDWLSSIKYDQDKEDKLIEWKKVLYKLVLGEAYRISENSSPRDYMGRVEERKGRKAGRLENLATAFNRFNSSIISDLDLGDKR